MRIGRWIGGALILVGVYGLGMQHNGDMVEVQPASQSQEMVNDVKSGWQETKDRWDAYFHGDEIKLSDDPAVSAGVCRRYEGKIVIYSCVPLNSPDGGVAIHAEEDGSALYTDGNGNGKRWSFDPEEMGFVQR